MEVFVTGSTGLLGQKFMKTLCARSDITRVYALARDLDRATMLLEKPLRKDFSKVVFLLGDVSKPQLGLSAKSILQLSSVEKFFHLAALVHLGQGERTAAKLSKINHSGTKHSLELVSSMPRLSHFLFVSTAYSAGHYGKEVPEEWLSNPKFFRNPYERSKWDCERLIKRRFSRSHITYSVIRPSILLDSLDNSMVSNHTIYLFSSFMLRYSMFVPRELKIVGNPKSTLNFVFVDDLIKLVLFASDMKQSQIYNFVNKESLSIEKLLSVIKPALRVTHDVHFIDSIPPESDDSLESSILRKTQPFVPYLMDGDMKWVSQNTEKLFSKHGVSMKGTSEIFENLEEYSSMLRKSKPLKLVMLSKLNKLKRLFK